MVETRWSSASNKRPLCSSSSPTSPPPNYFKRSKTAAATTEVSSTDGAPVPPVEIISSVKESELVASDLQATVVENPVLAHLDKSPVVVEAEDEDEDSPQSLERHIRTLSSGDIDRVLSCSSKNSSYRLPEVLVMIKSTSRGSEASGLVFRPYVHSNNVSQGLGCQLRGQSCYVEITLGCPQSDSDKALQSNSNSTVNIPKNHVVESSAIGRSDLKVSSDHLPSHEKIFIYPVEAVVVPVLQTSLARSSLKRFWLQNWIGAVDSAHANLPSYTAIELLIQQMTVLGQISHIYNVVSHKTNG